MRAPTSKDYPLLGEIQWSTQGYELSRFDGGYKGLEPRREQGNVQLIYLLSPANDRLLLTTHMNLLRSGNSGLETPVWNSEAYAGELVQLNLLYCVRRIHLRAGTPYICRGGTCAVVVDEGVWGEISWKPIDVDFNTSGSSIVPRHLSITYGDDSLRVFYASSLKTDQRVFIRHGTTPIIQCANAASEYEASVDKENEVRSTSQDKTEQDQKLEQAGWIVHSRPSPHQTR